MVSLLGSRVIDHFIKAHRPELGDRISFEVWHRRDVPSVVQQPPGSRLWRAPNDSYAAFSPFSAIPTSVRKIPVAPFSRASAVSHSSKNTTF